MTEPNKNRRALASVAATWWRELNERTSGADRAALAQLRRAPDIESILVLEAHQPLRQKARSALERSLAKEEEIALAVTTGVLAGLRSPTDSRVASALGSQGRGDEGAKVMSPLRFRQLLAARSPEDKLRRFRSAVQLLRRSANPLDLAEGILGWDKDMVRRRWIFAYHDAAANPPPAASDETAQDKSEELA